MLLNVPDARRTSSSIGNRSNADDRFRRCASNSGSDCGAIDGIGGVRHSSSVARTAASTPWDSASRNVSNRRRTVSNRSCTNGSSRTTPDGAIDISATPVLSSTNELTRSAASNAIRNPIGPPAEVAITAACPTPRWSSMRTASCARSSSVYADASYSDRPAPRRSYQISRRPSVAAVQRSRGPCHKVDDGPPYAPWTTRTGAPPGSPISSYATRRPLIRAIRMSADPQCPASPR